MNSVNVQYDVVLISQILNVHNCELLNLLHETTFRRYLTEEEVNGLAGKLNLTELPQDLHFFIDASREEGLKKQAQLYQKYQGRGPQRQVFPIPLAEGSYSENIDKPVEERPQNFFTKSPLQLAPSSLAIGIVWQFHTEQRRGWIVPIEQVSDSRKGEVEANGLLFHQKGDEVTDYRKWDVVSFRKKKLKAGHIRHQFGGVVAWFNGEYGIINSRVGEVFVHSRSVGQNSLSEGQLVCFTAHYDNNRNRYSAKSCQALNELADLSDKAEELATLNFLLFEKSGLDPSNLKNIPVSLQTIDALIRFRLASSFPERESPNISSFAVPSWEKISSTLSDNIGATQDVSSVLQPVAGLLKTIFQRMPRWFSDEAYPAQLTEACFWYPLQELPPNLSIANWIDYVIDAVRHIQKIWPNATCPEWCLDELHTNLQGWCSNLFLTSEAEEKEVTHRVRAAAALLNEQPTSFEQLIRYSPTYQFTWWLKRPIDFAFPNPDSLEELATLLEQVPDERLPNALGGLPTDKLSATYQHIHNANVRAALAMHLYERQTDVFKYVAFDLETDGHYKIREACFITPESVCQSRFASEAQQTDFLQNIQQSVHQSQFVIGHNIRAFDIPILTKMGVDFSQLSVWDTLEIEALLSPLQHSFALVTAHNAQQDVEKTLALFRNQLQRIVVNWPACAGTLWHIIPSTVSQWAEEFYASYGDVLPRPDSDLQSTFFHQIPVIFPFNLESLPLEQPTLLVAPRLVWSQFTGLPNVQFWTSNTTKNEFDLHTLQFDTHKVETVIRQPRIRQFILTFLNACQVANIAPTLANLPVWTRIQLLTELDDLSVVCSTTSTLPAEPVPGDYWITDDWGYLSLSETDSAVYRIHHLDSRLSAVTFKHQVGQLRLHDSTELFNQTGLWTRMVGGNRFAPIPRHWLDSLPGTSTIPAQLNNFWLEKHNATELVVWGNIAHANLHEQLQNDEGEELPSMSAIETCPLTLVYTKEQSGLFYRLNPETPYRDVYWTGQLYLLQQLATQQPVVWLVQQDHECRHLQALLESMGYYCPPEERSLIRRLEMLYHSTNRRRVLIAPLPMLPVIAQMNYWGPLTFIVDSLPLTEVAMMVPKLVKPQESEDIGDKETYEPDNDQDGEGGEEEADIENNRTQTETQPIKLQRINLDVSFELLAPVLQYYRQLLHRYQPANNLIVIDTRLSDQIGLAKRWKAKNQIVALWEHEDEYKALYEQVSKYVPSPKQVTLTLTDLPKIQQTIERVFLGQNEQGDWLRLRENQQPYFDSIIQASNDLIVSLPTGGGKSVLFQGPALYRGSLSNRLTIVITPLRALMEDQVMKLEELGFFGCVEYINQQSDDVQDIYRRIAGGEITLVYVTPERFRSRSFDRALKMRIQRDGGLEYCVFDEAHCISQWGSEFRPDYLWVAMLINRIKKTNGNFPALFFSATISEQIYNDLTEIFQ